MAEQRIITSHAKGVTIQSNIKRNTKDFESYSMFLGGLDVTSKNVDQFDPLRGGYARIFLVNLPRFMREYNNDLCKRFKHYVEMGFTGITGIGNTTMEFENITGGYAGNKFDIPSVCRDETDGITIRLYEMSGSPIREFIDTWMTGMSDPLTGLATYHGMLSNELTFRTINHIMEAFYVCTDPTGNLVEYCCMFANMMPKTVAKSHFEFEPGSHPAVQLDLDFTATRYESPQINEIGIALLNKFKILRDYLDFDSGYTTAYVTGLDSKISATGDVYRSVNATGQQSGTTAAGV